ncbi:hypothetical protein [Dendronalium sp. ChiSLP03b]|uniref:hypothetical protein n=1 Tax=Dendronalium sp. ChiSLP03b TaxID=3075381 RepID=UPI002AD422F0|nr:hypothetical protein [Dendronalium sp. ChiSLP03b]MDZ8205906.1 hypothetical protein [Dendronalium sp. ChiSLP03b]
MTGTQGSPQVEEAVRCGASAVRRFPTLGNSLPLRYPLKRLAWGSHGSPLKSGNPPTRLPPRCSNCRQLAS